MGGFEGMYGLEYFARQVPNCQGSDAVFCV